jgi:AcrR family transcriptional regulator
MMKVPEAGVKRKMLDAAEQLVAAKGFDSVSTRDVTGAVEANVAAVNYHFGSREGLLALVMTHVLEPLHAERIARLEAAGKQASTEQAVAAFVNALEPAAARIGMDARLFFRLAGRIQCLPDEVLPDAMQDARREMTRRFLVPLGKEFAAEWAFFQAGLAQSLIEQAESKNIAALMDRWIALGVLSFGKASSEAADDSQGLLFDF